MLVENLSGPHLAFWEARARGIPEFQVGQKEYVYLRLTPFGEPEARIVSNGIDRVLPAVPVEARTLVHQVFGSDVQHQISPEMPD